MAGAALTFDFSTVDRLAKSFAEIAERSGDTTPLMDEIGGYLEYSIDRRFETERGPGGTPWAKTIRGHSILKGAPPRLRSSITRQAGRRSVTVGTNLIYAGVHQRGATITPRNGEFLIFRIGGRTIFARSVTIPARPFLGIDAADRTEIGHIVADWHRDLFQGRLQ